MSRKTGLLFISTLTSLLVGKIEVQIKGISLGYSTFSWSEQTKMGMNSSCFRIRFESNCRISQSTHQRILTILRESFYSNSNTNKVRETSKRQSPSTRLQKIQISGIRFLAIRVTFMKQVKQKALNTFLFYRHNLLFSR